MRDAITAIANKHGVVFDVSGTDMKLEMAGCQPLVIENVGPHLVSVAHFFIQNGDVVYDPEIVFSTRYAVLLGWVPVSCKMAYNGNIEETLAHTDGRGNITGFYHAQVNDVCSFCATWAKNIRQQGWLKHGVAARVRYAPTKQAA